MIKDSAYRTAIRIEQNFNDILSKIQGLESYRVHVVNTASKKDILGSIKESRDLRIELMSVDIVNLLMLHNTPEDVFNGKRRHTDTVAHRVIIYSMLKTIFKNRPKLAFLVSKVFRIDRTSVYHYDSIEAFTIREYSELNKELRLKLYKDIEKIVEKHFAN